MLSLTYYMLPVRMKVDARLASRRPVGGQALISGIFPVVKYLMDELRGDLGPGPCITRVESVEALLLDEANARMPMKQIDKCQDTWNSIFEEDDHKNQADSNA